MQKKAQNYVSTLVLIALIVPVVYFSITTMIAREVFSPQPIWLLFVNMLAILGGIAVFSFLNVIVHEIGHLIFGLFVKFKFKSIYIGAFTFEKVDNKIKFSFKKNKHFGACVMFPATMKHYYKRMTIQLFGGSFLTMFLVVAGALLLFLNYDVHTSIYSFLSTAFVVNAYMFLREIIPYSKDMVANDGCQIFGILRKSKPARIFMRLFAIQTEILNGIRPKNIDISFYEDIPEIEENSIERVIFENYRYIYNIDNGDIDKAMKNCDLIEQSIVGLDDVYKLPLYTDIFFNACHYQNDIEKAKRIYPLIENYVTFETNLTNLRIRMAYEFYVNGSYKTALELGRQGFMLQDSFLMKGLVPLEIRLIEEMATKIKEIKEVKERNKILK